MSSPNIVLNLKVSGGTQHQLEVSPDNTVQEVKEKCFALTNIALELQKLIYKGKILKNEEKLSDHNVQTGQTMHLIRGNPKGANMETVSAATTDTQTTENKISSSIPSSEPTATNPVTTPPPMMPPFNMEGMMPLMEQMFQRMGGGMMPGAGVDAGNGTLPGLNENLLSMMQSLGNNPEMLSRTLESPLFAQMQNQPFFNEMLNNPAVRQSLLNPEFLNSISEATLGAMNLNAQNTSGGTTAGNESNVQSSETGNGTQGGTTGNTTPGNMFDPMQFNLGNIQELLQRPEMQQTINSVREMMTNSNGLNMQGGFPNFDLGTMMAQLNQGQQGQNNNSSPPETRFAEQLNSLQEMGFIDRDANVQALVETGGNIDAAISRLLSN